MPQGGSLLMNMGFDSLAYYSEQTACGSDTLAALVNSQRCVIKGVENMTHS